MLSVSVCCICVVTGTKITLSIGDVYNLIVTDYNALVELYARLYY